MRTAVSISVLHDRKRPSAGKIRSAAMIRRSPTRTSEAAILLVSPLVAIRFTVISSQMGNPWLPSRRRRLRRHLFEEPAAGEQQKDDGRERVEIDGIATPKKICVAPEASEEKGEGNRQVDRDSLSTQPRQRFAEKRSRGVQDHGAEIELPPSNERVPRAGQSLRNKGGCLRA